MKEFEKKQRFIRCLENRYGKRFNEVSAFGCSCCEDREQTLFSRVCRDLVFVDVTTDDYDIIEVYPKRLVPWSLLERCEWAWDFIDKILNVDPRCVWFVAPEETKVIDGEIHVCILVGVHGDFFSSRG